MILAIESSCDDTAVALLTPQGEVLYSEISSQIKLHQSFGGVVPEIASRQHLKALPLLIQHLFTQVGKTPLDLTSIAVTQSPGLIGSVLVGVSYAKALAWALKLPLVPVDHLEGHLLAPFLDHPQLRFPYLALIASGGHTHLILAQGLGQYQLLGKTLDDACGEAYDKTAKIMGFPYPGGPTIEKLARHCPSPSYSFTLPLRGKKTLNFSFSGLKTAVLNQAKALEIRVEKKELIDYSQFMQEADEPRKTKVCDLAASFQQTVEKIIAQRMDQALKLYPAPQVVLTGGVAANEGLRRVLTKVAAKNRAAFFAPSLPYCSDNAAMIGFVASQYLKVKAFPLDLSLNANSKSPIALMECSHEG